MLAGAWALATALTWPLMLDLRSRIFGRFGDSLGTIWSLWRDQVYGFHPVGVQTVEYLGAPLGFTRNATTDLLSLAVGFPGWILSAIVGEIAAYNLLVVSGLALSGAAMYWLGRRLGAEPLAAGWAGLVFTMFPWHLERAAGSPGQTHLEALPLIVIAGLHWAEGGSDPAVERSWTRAGWVAGALLLGLVTDPYVGLMALVVAGVVGLVVVIPALRSGARRAAAGLVAAVALPPILVYGTLFAARNGGEGTASLARADSDLTTYSARAAEFVVPTHGSLLFGDETRGYLGAHLHGSNFAETSLFVGWVTIALAAAFLVAWAVARRPTGVERTSAWIGVALVVAGLVMALTSPLDLGPVEVPLPSEAVFDVAPYWRVFARFVAVVMLGLLILGVLALARVQRRGPRWLGVAAPLLAIGLSGAELAASPPAETLRLPPTPAAYEVLAATSPGTPVAAYPLARSDEAVNSTHLFWQRVHHHPLLNGAAVGTDADALREGLVSPRDPNTPPALAFLGVRLVAFDGPATPTPGLSPLSPGSMASLYRVTAAPADGAAFLTSGAGRAEVEPDGRTYRWLEGQVAEAKVMTRRPGRYVLRFSAGSYRIPRTLTLTAAGQRRTFRITGRGRTVDAAFTLPAGVSVVRLEASPDAERIPDGRTVSIRLGSWAVRQA